jgi:hypothetical protein
MDVAAQPMGDHDIRIGLRLPFAAQEAGANPFLAEQL